jgi:hypothetical protein
VLTIGNTICLSRGVKAGEICCKMIAIRGASHRNDRSARCCPWMKDCFFWCLTVFGGVPSRKGKGLVLWIELGGVEWVDGLWPGDEIPRLWTRINYHQVHPGGTVFRAWESVGTGVMPGLNSHNYRQRNADKIPRRVWQTIRRRKGQCLSLNI